MLNDNHFKVVKYFEDSKDVFNSVDIKGGVVIGVRCRNEDFGSIKIFTQYSELNSILKKVNTRFEDSISTLCTGAVPYKYSNKLQENYPQYAELAGNSFDLRTNALDKMAGKLFFSEKPNDGNYVKIIGLYNKKRTEMWIEKK